MDWLRTVAIFHGNRKNLQPGDGRSLKLFKYRPNLVVGSSNFKIQFSELKAAISNFPRVSLV